MYNADMISVIGKRTSNEDKHFILQNIDGKDETKAPINLYGVCDGHGGRFVSKFLSEKLPCVFINNQVAYPLKTTFVKQVFQYFQDELKKNHLKNAINTGSTCLIVVQYMKGPNMFLNVINTGDSRCIICRNNIGISLTKDHKPDMPEEKTRIKELGGEIEFDAEDDCCRIKGLSVSRAFGDIAASPYVVCTPDMFKYEIKSQDKFMVIACDGLYDVLDNQTIVNFILNQCYDLKTGMRTTTKIAKKLAEYAISKGSMDNITVIVVFFK
jgi:serine/threonine protein phosphatase PrpC